MQSTGKERSYSTLKSPVSAFSTSYLLSFMHFRQQIFYGDFKVEHRPSLTGSELIRKPVTRSRTRERVVKSLPGDLLFSPGKKHCKLAFEAL